MNLWQILRVYLILIILTTGNERRMKLTVIEYGGEPRQIECESFEFRGNQVTNWLRIKKADGCEALIHNACIIKNTGRK